MKYSKITISGKICTGKTTLLKNLQKELNWPVFMTGKLFRNYVTKNKFKLDQAEEQNDKLTKKIDYQVREMINSPGNLIVDGWMAGLMAKGLPDVLKILLISDDAARYQRFAKREMISIKEAQKQVDERQKNWFEKIEKIHKIKSEEFNNSKNYDLAIDTSSINSQDTFKKVLQVL